MAISKLSVKLKTDSGASSTDLITNSGALQISGALTGDKLLYRYSPDNGTTWTSWTATTGAIPAPSSEGTWTVQVLEQTKKGATVATTSLTFTLDKSAAAPSVGLQADTGSSGTDNVTNLGLLKVGAETGARLEYSVNGGKTWTTSYMAVEGANTVLVRQTDLAGNVSAAKSYSFTLDTKAAAAPSLGLANDSSDGGAGHAADLVSKDATLTVGGLEAGASVEYSADGMHWSGNFTAQEGINTVFARQVDTAGNASQAAQLVFTLDNQGPAAGDDHIATSAGVPITVANADLLANDSDSSGSVGMVGFATQSANGGAVIDNHDGSFTYVAAAGFSGADSFAYVVTDLAGNQSQAVVNVDVLPADPGPGGGGGGTPNQAPVAYQDLLAQAVVDSGQAVTVDALAYAYDPDGDPLSVVAPANLPAGISFDSQTQSFVFDPASYQAGDQVVFSYGITDGQLTTLASATFYVTAPSPFTAYDAQANSGLELTQALLAPNSGIQIDEGSIALVVSGAGAMNFYDGSLAPLGMNAGLLLTSGTTPGTVNTSTGFGADNGGPLDPVTWQYLTYNGDADLNAVVNTVFSTTSYDATTLSFDFTVTDPTATSVSFNLVFGSDEYPEWVDAYVDSAIVLVNGQNVALFNHDAMSPLSVIGSNLSAGYFQDNGDSHLPIEYDGVSKVLTIVAPVHPGTNTIKIGIGDTGDHILDSGIFISDLTASTWTGSGVYIEDTQTTAGDDQLQGSSASDLVDLSGGDDSIAAGAGDDMVDGGAGNDIISGGSGADVLTGGSGADEFDYTNLNDWAAYDYGFDTITDFAGNSQAISNAGNLDAIDGDVLVFDYAALASLAGPGWAAELQPAPGNFSTLSADYLSTNTDGSADLAHAQFVYDAASGLVAFDADGTGSQAPVPVTLIGNHPDALASAAFVLTQ